MTRTQVLLAALIVVLLIAAFWMFLFQPTREELADVEVRIAEQQTQQSRLEQEIARLRAVREEAPEVEAELATAEAVVPRDPSLPPALRQLQVAADESGVILQAVTTARPEPIVDELAAPPPPPPDEPADDEADDEEPGAEEPDADGVPDTPPPPAGPDIGGLSSIGISVQVLGGYFQVVDFLRRIEDPRISPRGLVWRDATIARDDDEAYPQLSVSLTGEVYAVIVEPPPPGTELAPDAPGVDDEEADTDDADTADPDVDVDVDVDVDADVDAEVDVDDEAEDTPEPGEDAPEPGDDAGTDDAGTDDAGPDDQTGTDDGSGDGA